MANQFEIVHDLLDLAGARWTVDVLSVMRDGKLRFNEISRAAFATIPPRVEYELTELGRDFAASVRPLGSFAVRNQQSIEAARRDFDGSAA